MIAFGPLIKGVLFAGPRIPLGTVVIAFGLVYFYWNTTYMIKARAYAREAVTKLIAAEQFAAMEAEITRVKALNADLQITVRAKTELAESWQKINADVTKELALKRVEAESWQDEVDEILSRQAPANRCLPPDGLLNVLPDS